MPLKKHVTLHGFASFKHSDWLVYFRPLKDDFFYLCRSSVAAYFIQVHLNDTFPENPQKFITTAKINLLKALNGE